MRHESDRLEEADNTMENPLIGFAEHKPNCKTRDPVTATQEVPNQCTCRLGEALAVADTLYMLDLSGVQNPDLTADALSTVIKHVEKAEAEFPYWPGDIIHAAGVVAEEAGELLQAALQETYEADTDPTGDTYLDRCLEEAGHTGATAIRFLINWVGMSRQPLKRFPAKREGAS